MRHYLPSEWKRWGESRPDPFSTLTLDVVQLRPFLLQLRLQRLGLRFEVGQSLVQLYLLCRHFRDERGSHIFPRCGRRSAAKGLKAELTADAADVRGREDAPQQRREDEEASCIPVMLHTGYLWFVEPAGS